jgi:hypothetical protein
MIKPVEAYLPALLLELQVPPTSPHINMYRAILTAVRLMLVDADVVPVGLPVPLTAPTGGGPVTGTGKLA